MEKKFTNKLAGSSSAYLKQHVHNPVDWYPFGEEALSLAKQQNKPILISIGYSTCYWCHVMEREIFEKPEIAKLMNEYFINIKVDREERPDLDELYMVARQIITREGGWPNNVFLTPDLKPFFAGGTFAADEKYGRPAFPDLLRFLNDAWLNKQEMILQSAESITKKMLEIIAKENISRVDLEPDIADDLADYLNEKYDAEYGGFYNAPKFPHETEIFFLLNYFESESKEWAKEIALQSLRKMAAGGIYDHIGGGFHRYSVDRYWHVPHFEKMLYNQANLALCYIKAFEISGDYFFKYIAKRILDFVLSDMCDENTRAFYSAWDAETDEVEGAYYAWKKEEVEEILGEKDAEVFFAYFSLADIPAFPGHKHPDGKALIRKKDFSKTKNEISLLEPFLEKLLRHRKTRKAPLLDTKIIASWNGMMIKAFSYAGEIFKEEKYKQAAQKAAEFILSEMTDKDGNLFRIYNEGKKSISAFLEDYAYMLSAVLALYKHSRNKKWLDKATALAAKIDELFLDKNNGGYFFDDVKNNLILRAKNSLESAYPSANSVMAHNFTELYFLTEDVKWQDKAKNQIAAFSAEIAQFPAQFSHMVHSFMNLQKLTLTTDTDSKSKVKIKGKIISQDSKKNIYEAEIILSIEEGWHIAAADKQQNIFSLEIESLNTEIQKIIFPEAEIISYGKDKVAAYSQEIKIPVNFIGSREPVANFKISFQACNNNLCLAKSDTILRISL